MTTLSAERFADDIVAFDTALWGNEGHFHQGYKTGMVTHTTPVNCVFYTLQVEFTRDWSGRMYIHGTGVRDNGSRESVWECSVPATEQGVQVIMHKVPEIAAGLPIRSIFSD